MRTREVKLCRAFTQTTVDEDGRPVRDPRSSSYLATFAPAAEFGTLMAAEARRRSAERAHRLCHPRRRRGLDLESGRHFPAATQIAGLYHAREHPMGCQRALGRDLAAATQPDRSGLTPGI